MIKFITQMKSCDVVTVSDGTVQAIKGPIAYIGYMDQFEGKSFAIDAKMFVAALKKLDNDFHISVSKDKVVLYDDKQEVNFVVQPAEQLLEVPQGEWQFIGDFLEEWNSAHAFMSSDFPGIAIRQGYLEVLSDSSIARINTEIDLPHGIYAGVKLPKSIKTACVVNNKLWLRATPTDYIVINSLAVDFPNVDGYYNNWPTDWTEIPSRLREKFIPTKKVRYDNNTVQFIEQDKATAIIENIPGSGTYDGGLFKSMLELANEYHFAHGYLAFQNSGVRGIIANVGN